MRSLHQGEAGEGHEVDDWGQAPLRVLLVEDEALQAHAVQSLVHEASEGEIEVALAERLETALDRLEQERFDAVLLDLMLPDAEGLHGLRRVLRSAPGLPVLVLTGLGHEELVRRAFDEGAQDYLIKGSESGPDLVRAMRYAIRRKAAELRRLELARADPLTGLANRAVLMERLSRAKLRADRERRPFAVLFLDLDGFKGVNDSMGHVVGDRLLQDVAARLTTVTRQVDTVARLGGDEFVMLAEGLHGAGDAAVVAGKALGNLSQPFEIDGRHVRIGGSIGISVYPHDTIDLDWLMRLADDAMYRAKRGGRNRFAFSANAPQLRRSLVPD